MVSVYSGLGWAPAARRIPFHQGETGDMTGRIRARSRRRARKTAQVLVALETIALERHDRLARMRV